MRNKMFIKLIISCFFGLLSFSISHAGVNTYEYDDFHRITQVIHSDGATVVYKYDNVGNRTSKVVYNAYIYVDDDNISGPWDGTEGHPYQSINEALSVATEGSIVFVMPGEYVENYNSVIGVYIPVSNITLRGSGPQNTIIRPAEPIVSKTVIVVAPDTAGTIIEGFTITGGYSDSPGSRPGGIQVWRSSATIKNNIITENQGYPGGGIYFYSNSSSNTLFVYNNLISNNISGDNGGGISLYGLDNQAIIHNNTIVNNTASSNGGGVYGVQAEINNCIFWHNSSDLSGLYAYYSYIENDHQGIGNIGPWNGYVSPGFLDEISQNYQLSSNSPCKNSGINHDWMATETDIIGNPRIIDHTVDMGAYEFIEADIDGDGLPDTLENSFCTDSNDADTDDDGLTDGTEDANHNGIVDSGETDPCNVDTDGDGIQDGTELGVSSIGSDTDASVFIPDADPSITTDPIDPDTDDDGIVDGNEDLNSNGRVDPGESDPNVFDADSTLWSMGRNSSGQLGDSTTTYRLTPVQVAIDVSQVAGGSFHSLFVKTDDTLWAMGDNSSGQLGDGTTTTRIMPVQVTTDVSQADGGYNYSLIVKTDDTLWAMGDNSSGQLGDGTTTASSTPVQIANNVSQVAAGYYHSLFVKTDGTLWAMGWNYYGQLGDGTTTNHSTPVQIAIDVSQVATGPYHSLFAKTDGTLWAMGRNILGELGDGTTTIRITPVQVATDVSQVAAGAVHSMFVKINGTLWTMGSNGDGQLGDGTNIDRTTPVQVDTDVSKVAAGRFHSLYLQASDIQDSDGDGLQDSLEEGGCTNPLDADTDDDGLTDGTEDANQNGIVDAGETDPCNVDTDGDGIQDGTESGFTLQDLNAETDTDVNIFIPDTDPTTTTDPLDEDSDDDSLLDGEEDVNHNGQVDERETDPNFDNNDVDIKWDQIDLEIIDNLTDIWGASDSDIHIVGHDGTTLRYNGTNWDVVESGTNSNLLAIWGSASNNLYAVGGVHPLQECTILHFDGANWTGMDEPTTKPLYDIWGASNSDIWAVGNSGDTGTGFMGALLHFDGSTWSEVSTSGLVGVPITGIWGSTATNVFAVAVNGLILNFDGLDWNLMEDTSASRLNSIWGSGPNDIFAVGSDGMIFHYDGSNWIEMNSNSTEELLSVWGGSNSDVYAVGFNGTILHFDGYSWESMNSGTSEILFGIWGANSSDIYIVGANGTILHKNEGAVENDVDGDGLIDTLENSVPCLSADDPDTDDDGIVDGMEDANHNGVVDPGETNPCSLDTDGDGIQDGTEIGLTIVDIGLGTDTNVFIPDADPNTTTDPLNADSDNDGLLDGQEDRNQNGAVDGDETDPNAIDKPKSMPWIPLLLLTESDSCSSTAWVNKGTEIKALNIGSCGGQFTSVMLTCTPETVGTQVFIADEAIYPKDDPEHQGVSATISGNDLTYTYQNGCINEHFQNVSAVVYECQCQ